MSTFIQKKPKRKRFRHHCCIILTHWCRILNLNALAISEINSTVCQNIIAYRGPGNILAFSSNSRLSSIEIYNSITKCNPKDNDDNSSHELLNKLTMKTVHVDMKFKSSNSFSNKNIIRTWHPTLCSTLDYKYVYRVGGGNIHRGLLGESTRNVDVFNLYNMTQITLPSMTYSRAKCSATILPPNIPYHEYIETTKNNDNNNNHFLFINQLKSSISSSISPTTNQSISPLSPTRPVSGLGALLTASLKDKKEQKISTTAPPVLSISKATPLSPPVSPSAPVSLPIAINVSISAPGATSVPAPVPAPIPVAVTAPVPAPIPAPVPIGAPAPAPAPVPVSVKDISLSPLAPPLPALPIPPLNINNSASGASASLSSITYGGRSRKNSQLHAEYIKNNISNKAIEYKSKYPEYCLFVSGGINNDKSLKKCEIFYPYENKWNDVTSMKQSRCEHVTQYLGSTEYKHSLSSGYNFSLSKISEWKDISDLTTKIFVCGGRREHGNGITSAECFDVEDNKWTMCRRAPFSNNGYQSGTWWSTKKSVAIISDPFNSNNVAVYSPNKNEWNIIGNTKYSKESHLIHFYPLIGTLWLFNNEYLYICGDDYKCKNLEIYDERIDKWIPIGIKQKLFDKNDPTMIQTYDTLQSLTNYKQFDAFESVS